MDARMDGSWLPIDGRVLTRGMSTPLSQLFTRKDGREPCGNLSPLKMAKLFISNWGLIKISMMVLTRKDGI